VFGPRGAASSARGAHMFKARAGHHLPPQLLSSGRNVFEALGKDFTLLALDTTDTVELAFASAAKGLAIPLKIVRDSYDQGRRAYEAKFILVRPDRYVAWTGNAPPDDPVAIFAKAVAKPVV
jgi:4-hydroxyisophthalate hydroxylase